MAGQHNACWALPGPIFRRYLKWPRALSTNLNNRLCCRVGKCRPQTQEAARDTSEKWQGKSGVSVLVQDRPGDTASGTVSGTTRNFWLIPQHGKQSVWACVNTKHQLNPWRGRDNLATRDLEESLKDFLQPHLSTSIKTTLLGILLIHLDVSLPALLADCSSFPFYIFILPITQRYNFFF